MAQAQPKIDKALDAIEGAVLPSLSLLLDDALDSAAMARPGADAERHAAQLRRTAGQLDGLARLLESVQAFQPPVAAAPRRMSA